MDSMHRPPQQCFLIWVTHVYLSLVSKHLPNAQCFLLVFLNYLQVSTTVASLGFFNHHFQWISKLYRRQKQWIWFNDGWFRRKSNNLWADRSNEAALVKVQLLAKIIAHCHNFWVHRIPQALLKMLEPTFSRLVKSILYRMDLSVKVGGYFEGAEHYTTYVTERRLVWSATS